MSEPLTTLTTETLSEAAREAPGGWGVVSDAVTHATGWPLSPPRGAWRKAGGAVPVPHSALLLPARPPPARVPHSHADGNVPGQAGR